MADNTDEEHLDNRTNKQSENLSYHIISSKDKETINPNQETENMEVHKHPHNVTHKKKWGEYLLEFIMLFLAVFLGFIAENIRESSVEHQKEKEYIHSMINDLKADTLKLNEVIAGYQLFTQMQDTLITTFSTLQKGDNEVLVKYLGGIMGFPDFIYSDATIQQLKNAGGFRIFRNRNDIDSIMAYDAKVKKTLINEAYLSKNYEQLQNLFKETFNILKINQLLGLSIYSDVDTKDFKLLLTHDEHKLLTFFNQIVYYSLNCKSRITEMKETKMEATKLIKYLEKEYDMH